MTSLKREPNRPKRIAMIKGPPAKPNFSGTGIPGMAIGKEPNNMPMAIPMKMAILLPMDTAILIHIQVLTSISDTDDGNIAQFRPWFDGRN